MVDYLYKGPAMCDSDDFLALVCTSCKKLSSFILMMNIAYISRGINLYQTDTLSYFNIWYNYHRIKFTKFVLYEQADMAGH